MSGAGLQVSVGWAVVGWNHSTLMRQLGPRLQARALPLTRCSRPQAPTSPPTCPTGPAPAVRSFAQGAAAAQSGVSVIQPNVGRLHDWYNRHPGYIRDPKVRGWGAGGRFGRGERRRASRS